MVAGYSVASAQTWQPGSDASVTVPNLDTPVPVRVPDNYVADRSWPAVFHYHTKGMQPNVLLTRTYTEGRDFVLVGMPREREDVFFGRRRVLARAASTFARRADPSHQLGPEN